MKKLNKRLSRFVWEEVADEDFEPFTLYGKEGGPFEDCVSIS